MPDRGGDWLKALGLECYESLFAEHAIDRDAAGLLTDEDFRALGIPLGHVRRLQAASRGEQAPPVLPEPLADAPAAAPAPEPEAGAERRQVTVLFIDLVGSSTLAAGRDPEEVNAILREYQDTVAGEIARHGGYVAKFMGDGILVYFGWPTVRENEVECAVRAALASVAAVRRLETPEGRKLDARVGCATGLVVIGELIGLGEARERTIAGETPNLAARLQAAAEPGCVLLSETTRALLPASFLFGTARSVELKGFDQPVRVSHVLREIDAPSRFEAAGRDRGKPLLSRDLELSLLEERWRLARGGEAQCVVLVGEAGIGKSRIVRALLETLDHTAFTRLFFQCSPLHHETPFWPVAQQFKREAGLVDGTRVADARQIIEASLPLEERARPGLVDAIADTLSLATTPSPAFAAMQPEARRTLAQRGLLARIAHLCATRPVLMVFEDIHWIDPSSLEFLRRAIGESDRRQLMILATTRTEGADCLRGFAHATQLALNRLPRRSIAEIVRLTAGKTALTDEAIEEIVERTDGVPLFAEEVTKAVAEAQRRGSVAAPIPASLHDTLVARLDHAPEVKRVAQLCACIGRVVRRSLLAAVADLPSEALDVAIVALLRAEILLDRGDGRYVFRHALLQDAAYQTLLKSARQRLHASIADCLLAQIPASRPEQVAHHLECGGRLSEASTQWLEAARQSARMWAHNEAIAFFRAALRTLGPDGDPAHELAVRLDLVESLRITDRLADALDALPLCEALARKVGQDSEWLRLRLLEGNILFVLGQAERCAQAQHAALEIAERIGHPQAQARALSGLGDARFALWHVAAAEQAFDRCVRLAQAHGLDEIVPPNLCLRGHMRLYLARMDEALADCVRALELAEEAGNPRAAVVARGSCLGKVLLELARFEEADAAFAQASDMALQTGMKRYVPLNQAFRAMVALAWYDRSAARDIAARAVAEAEALPPRFCLPIALGVLARASDDPGAVRAAIARGEQVIDEGALAHNPLWFYRDAGLAAARLGDAGEVRRLADRLAHAFTGEDLRWCALAVEGLRGLACIIEGSGGGIALPSLVQTITASGLAGWAHVLDEAGGGRGPGERRAR